MSERTRILLLALAATILAGLFYLDRAGHLGGAEQEGVVTAVSRDGADGGNADPAGPTASGEIQANPLRDLDLEGLEATRERPLFTPGREAPRPRPAPEPEVAETPPETPEAPEPAVRRGQFDLLGVIRSEERSVAVLRHRGSGEVLSVREGETVEGWRLNEVRRTHVILIHEELEETLRLFSEEEQ